VLESTFTKSKRFGTVWDGKQNIFVSHLSVAGNRKGGDISVASTSQL
jgi:hypothetical protein